MKYTMIMLVVLLGPCSLRAGPLPEVPVPAENPLTEAKRVLGKILFWEEQLSVDNSVACGSCHRPGSGGADPRTARHPGPDGEEGNADDVIGSPGIRAMDALGHALPGHPADRVQVTNRSAPSYFMGLWAETLFWDGRAGGRFQDPQSGELLIAEGGALENQALGPLMNPAEMGSQGRRWQPLLRKLERVAPLALASDLPPDMAAALVEHASYPELFNAAFGTPGISAARIAMAIATHERTLVADQTPWDRAQAEGTFLPGRQNLGWEVFQDVGCVQCHTPPLFTDNDFHNIGIRERSGDPGRMAVSGDEAERGAMKTPSLRNAALKKRFMHSGQFSSLAEVLDAYANVPFPAAADEMPEGGDYDFNLTESQRSAVLVFLESALTDPRVAEERYPFDRPLLRSELSAPDTSPEPPRMLHATLPQHGDPLLSWQPGDTHTRDYRILRDDGLQAWTTNTRWRDRHARPGRTYSYRVFARSAAFVESEASRVEIRKAYPALLWWGLALVGTLLAAGLLRYRIRRRPAARP